MSFSQSLIIPQHDDIFAPSWQAGVSNSQLTKSLRNYDIESVNVAKTCEKLCLALSENQNSNYEPSQDVETADRQCAVRKSNIPFRDFSNIWFGTLKIYQQQVNTLFRLSQDLLSRSGNYEIKHLEASKRKSSLKSHKLIKKRRFTLTESTNFSELLDDLEKLASDHIQKPVKEKSSQSFSRSIKQFQIREITIREISATIHSTADIVDEDSGFGEATHEEMAEFLNFSADNSRFNIKKTPTKRKPTCELEPATEQKRFIQDSSVDPEYNQTIEITRNGLKTSLLKKSITPANYTDAFAQNEFMENLYTPTNVLQQNVIDNNDIIGVNRIKSENGRDVEDNRLSMVLRTKKKKLKLIIDECTKIDISDHIHEMKNAKLSTNLVRKRILKTYEAKKCKAALELLTRFNRRSLKLSLTLKQKIYVSQEQFERDYLNLLREIFNMNYKKKWASEIYPKWKCFKDALQKANNTPRVNKLRNRKKSDLNKLHEYLNTDVMGDDNNAIYNINQELQNQETHNIELKSCGHDNWSPYGVMVNLLNLWHFNQTNKIAASTLFKLAENRIDRALGFYSLLSLSKKKFVFLTKFPETIALQNILMGKAIDGSITSQY